MSSLDEMLARFYGGASVALQQSPCLKTDQRAWLTTMRNRCGNVACLRNAYLTRLSALSALQPGMALPKSITLPPTLRLRWIVPPAEDQVATPKLPSKLFQVAGIVDHIVDKGGYVLVADDASVHTLIPEMLMDGESAVQLGVLREMKTKVAASGRHAVVNGDALFDNRYCVLIYERP